MRIRKLSLRDYCGWKNAEIDFEEFACLIGPNGIGKTTILNAVHMLCNSLDYEDPIRPDVDIEKVDPEVGTDWTPEITAKARLRASLERNVRNFGEPTSAKTFSVEGIFEHGGQDFVVKATQDGFERNDVIKQDWWWPGIVYFAKFDSDMVNFQLRVELWDKFKAAYEGITGLQVEPEIYKETDLELMGLPCEIVTGFYIHKWGNRVHSRRASAGEKKIAKALTQVVNLEEDRQPEIVLVDNLEMHVHYTRHLRMFDEIKRLFAGKQIITTTHSTTIIQKYEPKQHIVDCEAVKFLEDMA